MTIGEREHGTTTEVKRESEDNEISIKEGVVASGRFASVRVATAKEGACSFELDLPATGLRLFDVNPASLKVSVEFAGTRAFVKQNFPYSDKPVGVAGGRCFDGGAVSCVKGPLAFRISSYFAHQEKDFGDPDLEWRDRYRVNGRTVTISSPGGDSRVANEAFLRQKQLLFDHVLVELATIILRKI